MLNLCEVGCSEVRNLPCKSPEITSNMTETTGRACIERTAYKNSWNDLLSCRLSCRAAKSHIQTGICHNIQGITRRKASCSVTPTVMSDIMCCIAVSIPRVWAWNLRIAYSCSWHQFGCRRPGLLGITIRWASVYTSLHHKQ